MIATVSASSAPSAAAPPPHRPPRWTLGGLFVLVVLSVTILVGATFFGFIEISRRAILERSLELRDEEARRIEQRLSADLGVAKATVDDVERALTLKTLAPDDSLAVEARLFSSIVDN